MKKHFYLISLFILFIIKAYGQVAILTFANNGPVPGDVFTSFNADTTGVINGSPGANQSWNYSGLIIDTSKTVKNYVTSSSTPYVASFPDATVVFMNNPSYSYLKVNSSEYTILGLASPLGIMIYSDPETIFTYPFSYGQSITDSLKGSYQITGTANYFYRSGTRNTTADGYGTLILPSGTYTNMLRTKTIQDYKDSLSSTGTVTHVYNVGYAWYDGTHKNSSLFIYDVTNTTGGNVSKSRFVTVSSAVSNIAEITSLHDNFSIYPNPANDYLQIQSPQNISFELMNIQGQLISDIKSAGTTTNVDLSKLAAGIYFIKAMYESGSIVKKFIKQ
jgi:hypothetical protein